MTNHPVLKKVIAAAMLSAAFATPAAVLTAGAASARPIEGSCGAIAQSMQDSMHMADVAYSQGDRKAGDAHTFDARRALGHYNRKCL
jgi:thiamine monophosphate kinase